MVSIRLATQPKCGTGGAGKEKGSLDMPLATIAAPWFRYAPLLNPSVFFIF
jgi:hypothetical protein